MIKVFVFGLQNIKGGVETLFHSLMLSKIKERKNFEFTIIADRPHIEFEEEYLKYGIDVIHITGFKTKGLAYFNLLRACFASLKSTDILHVNISSYRNFFLFEALKHCKAHIIIHGHNSSKKGIINNIVHKLSRAIYRKIGYKIAISKKVDSFMFKNHSDSIIPNGIPSEAFAFDLEARKQIRNQLGIKEDDLLIGVFGRIAKDKNTSFALKLARIAPSQIKFLIIGQYTCSKHYRDLFSSIPRNTILIDKQIELNNYYSAVDCIYMPSLSEGVSLVVCEALSSGLPVIGCEKSVGFFGQMPNVFITNHKPKDVLFSFSKVKKYPLLPRLNLIASTPLDISSFAYSMFTLYSTLADEINK